MPFKGASTSLLNENLTEHFSLFNLRDLCCMFTEGTKCMFGDPGMLTRLGNSDVI